MHHCVFFQRLASHLAVLLVLLTFTAVTKAATVLEQSDQRINLFESAIAIPDPNNSYSPDDMLRMATQPQYIIK